jgi:hypothetical protein
MWPLLVEKTSFGSNNYFQPTTLGGKASSRHRRIALREMQPSQPS